MQTLNVFDLVVTQPLKCLNTLSALLDKAEGFSKEKKLKSEAIVLGAYLAPDQFNFTRQVQTVCDNAKLMSGRLSNVPAPSFPDDETTFEALRARIAKTIAYLADLTPEAFEGWGDRRAEFFFAPGMHLSGEDYVIQFALPNFYFHLASAYSILRHIGVEIGKADFLGGLPFKKN